VLRAQPRSPRREPPRPQTAQAAPGQAVILGATNGSGTLGTTIVAASTAPAVTIRNTGAGALMTSLNSNGFAGGSYSPNRYGLSAANFATVAGSGAAIAASGAQNDGILTSTVNPNRAGLFARNDTAVAGEGAAVLAYGPNVAGVVTLNSTPDDFALWAIGNGGNALVAIGSSVIDGDLIITGDLVVQGTIFCNNPIQPIPVAAQSTESVVPQSTESVVQRVRDRAKSS
jgi:hypothetical protein